MIATNADNSFGSLPAFVGRRGATLIELLVVMALIAALSALALMLLPSAANSDAALKGAGEVQGACRVAQSMAASSRLPRGIRLAPGPAGSPTQLIATEIQYLEAPPVMIADPQVLVGGRTGNPNGVFGPRIEIRCDFSPGPNPPAGAITVRHCYIVGLTIEQEDQVRDGSIVVLPTLGFWSRVVGNPVLQTAPPTSLPPPRTLEVVLEVYPDAHLGGATAFRTYHFGIYGPPVPLLAEPTLPLPKDIGVDLSISYPIGQPGQYYDIMFAPSGQTISSASVAGNTSVYLWVRDITKGSPTGDMTPLTMPPPTSPGVTAATPGQGWTFDMNKFRRGGEQQIVGIRNGFVGTAPVLWPDNATGTYGTPPVTQDPFSLARNQLQ